MAAHDRVRNGLNPYRYSQNNPATAVALLVEGAGTLAGKSAYNMATKGRPDFMDAVRETGYVLLGSWPEPAYRYPSIAGNYGG